MQSKIGFIGLGAMGKPMAANIAKAGFELTVCDLREEPCKELAALGARGVASPREGAEKSELIEIAVVDDAQAERVVTGEHGVMHGAGTCWITGRGANGRKNLKRFAGSAPRSSRKACRPRWN